MSHVVYARYDTTAVWSQGTSPTSLGEVWDSEAPLALERPDLFSAEPTRVRGRRAQAPDVDTPKTDPEQGKQPDPPAEPAPVVDKPARATGKGRG